MIQPHVLASVTATGSARSAINVPASSMISTVTLLQQVLDGPPLVRSTPPPATAIVFPTFRARNVTLVVLPAPTVVWDSSMVKPVVAFARHFQASIVTSVTSNAFLIKELSKTILVPAAVYTSSLVRCAPNAILLRSNARMEAFCRMIPITGSVTAPVLPSMGLTTGEEIFVTNAS